uniref:Secreted protein n=1 Tax=Anthurium amnicola TaxID=1678845 RepID=A0A1D1XZD4_9ARAE
MPAWIIQWAPIPHWALLLLQKLLMRQQVSEGNVLPRVSTPSWMQFHDHLIVTCDRVQRGIVHPFMAAFSRLSNCDQKVVIGCNWVSPKGLTASIPPPPNTHTNDPICPPRGNALVKLDILRPHLM